MHIPCYLRDDFEEQVEAEMAKMHNDDIADDADTLIEEGYAKMMTGFYRLRKAGLIQDEYDQMGVIIDMLSQDRQHIRKTYKVNI